MPNPYALSNIGNFAYPGPGKTPTGVLPPMAPNREPMMGPPPAPEMPPLPGAPVNPFVRAQADARPVPDWVPGPPPPSGGGGFPSGWNAGASVPGKMTVGPEGMGDMSSALRGLSQAQFPELERIKNAHAMIQQGLGAGAGAGLSSLRLGDAAEQDVMKSLAPQATQVGGINHAIQSQHPAVAGLAERSAVQKAYPQQAEAAGRVQAADIAADADVKGKGIDADSHQNTAMRGQFEHIVKAMIEARKIMATQGLPEEQVLQAKHDYEMWNNALMGLSQSGGLF